jgi:HSP20 family molecular chaperone IbpA
MSLINFELPLGSSSYFVCPETRRIKRDLSAVKIDKHGNFKYTCNFQGFRLSEIKIHHEGNHVIIMAESKHSGPLEACKKSMQRIIKLPDDIDKQSVRCKLNDKGEIVVHANKLVQSLKR